MHVYTRQASLTHLRGPSGLIQTESRFQTDAAQNLDFRVFAPERSPHLHHRTAALVPADPIPERPACLPPRAHPTVPLTAPALSPTVPRAQRPPHRW